MVCNKNSYISFVLKCHSLAIIMLEKLESSRSIYLCDVKAVRCKRPKNDQILTLHIRFWRSWAEMRLSYGIPFFILEFFNSVLKSRLLSESEGRP